MENYLLCILGSSVDSFYSADEYPLEGDFTHAKFLGNSIGGCPLNVGAVAASKGTSVKALDMLGKNDETTSFILNELKRLNINTEDVYLKEDVSNGKVIIINTKDLRTMFVVDPIRPYYEITEKIQNVLNNSTYIYSLMHMINRSFENIEPLLIAKRNGAKIILDGSSKYDDPKRVETLYKLADGLFINEVDYERLKNHSYKDPKEIIFENNGLFICVTKGSKGSTLYLKDKTINIDSLPNLKVIDSTGAGDAFAGAFIASLLKNKDYEQALKYATINGAYACTKFGSIGGVASFEELDEFYKNYEEKL